MNLSDDGDGCAVCADGPLAEDEACATRPGGAIKPTRAARATATALTTPYAPAFCVVATLSTGVFTTDSLLRSRPTR